MAIIILLLLEINVNCFVFGPKNQSSTEPIKKSEQNKIKQKSTSQCFITAVSVAAKRELGWDVLKNSEVTECRARQRCSVEGGVCVIACSVQSALQRHYISGNHEKLPLGQLQKKWKNPSHTWKPCIQVVPLIVCMSVREMHKIVCILSLSHNKLMNTLVIQR